MTHEPRESDLLALLWREGPLSRWELHQRMGLRANTVGQIAAGLIDRGVLREGAAAANGRGRPRVPLEIDPDRRQVLGLALEPGRIGYGRLNLRGERGGKVSWQRGTAGGGKRTGRAATPLIDKAVGLLSAAGSDRLAAVGVSVPGFIDLDRQVILLSSATPGQGSVSLQPLHDAADRLGVPLVVENDMHALAAQWSLTHQADQRDDILLVSVRDGAVGAAVLVEGRPNRGCVGGGNELGHHRFLVDTEACYCGHRGCLERICSTAYLRRTDPRAPTLAQAVARFDPADGRVHEVVGHLATGLANAVNFIRPNRVVIASPLLASPRFGRALTDRTRAGLLGVLADRVRIDLWHQPTSAFAQAAGWLALTSLYRTGWGAPAR